MNKSYPDPVYFCWSCEGQTHGVVISDTHYSEDRIIYFCSEPCKEFHEQLKSL